MNPATRTTALPWWGWVLEVVAILAVSEASYRYVATKSQAKPRALQKLTVGVADAGAVRQAFEQGVAVAHGVEWAREWANRPGNHATPTLLAEAARLEAGDDPQQWLPAYFAKVRALNKK